MMSQTLDRLAAQASDVIVSASDIDIRTDIDTDIGTDIDTDTDTDTYTHARVRARTHTLSLFLSHT